ASPAALPFLERAAAIASMGVPSLPHDPSMDIAFWVYVYIAAAVQAALLALALWRRFANREANRLLAVWVALTGLDLAVKAAYWHTLAPEWFRAYRFVALFPFLYGSLFFLYVRALTRGVGFRWRDLRHLLGFAAMLLVTGHVLLATPARAAFRRGSPVAALDRRHGGLPGGDLVHRHRAGAGLLADPQLWPAVRRHRGLDLRGGLVQPGPAAGGDRARGRSGGRGDGSARCERRTGRCTL